MLGSFLDKMGGFFDRRFIVAYVIPTLVILGVAIGVSQALFGPRQTLSWWKTLDGQEQILIGTGLLLAIIVLSYILEMLTAPIVRFYEGYWTDGGLKTCLKNIAISYQRKQLSRHEREVEIAGLEAKQQKLLSKEQELISKQQTESPEQQAALAKQLDELFEELMKIKSQVAFERKRAYNATYYKFPRISNLLKPTLLGNVLSAAEEYSYQIYRLDAVIWWPRLASLLPETFRTQVDAALTPMLTVLNLSIIFALLSLIAVILPLISHQWFLWGLTFFFVGLILTRACYSAAINQAIIYGQLIRVGFDLYRQEILKQMHIPIPDNLVDERMLWERLTNWHYHYQVPWTEKYETPEKDKTFYYDTHCPTSDVEQQDQVTLILKGVSQMTIKDDVPKKAT